jgi:hypothetical protein
MSQERSCWICGSPADSAEHIFKARDLKRFFANDGYTPEAMPYRFSGHGHRRIPGPKSDRIKYPKIICRRCNNERTSRSDKAYNRMSDWLNLRQSDHSIAAIDLLEIFGPTFSESVEELRRFFAKSLGCRIVASGSILPAEFPNPVSGSNMDHSEISFCRSEPLRDLADLTGQTYDPKLFEGILGKGELLVLLSKSHLEATGEKLVTSAVWWENLGHFQVNYWFNIAVNPVFGEPLLPSKRLYRLVHNNLGLSDTIESMWACLGEVNIPVLGSALRGYVT